MEETFDRSLQALAAQISTGTSRELVVVNPLAHARTDLVLSRDLPGVPLDPVGGAPLPTQTLSDGRTAFLARDIPAFGYKNHASIDCRHGFIRGWNVTSASAYDGAQLRNVLNRGNTGSTVWADTAYRSKTNEEWLEKNGYVSDIHHKKPKGRPMSEAMSRANGRRSKIRAFVEHVFAQQKSRMGLFVRTIGIARARTKIGMANLAYNLTRFVWHQGRTAPA